MERKGQYAEMFAMQARNYLADDEEIRTGVFAAQTAKGAAV
jgi:hypothetical protein